MTVAPPLELESRLRLVMRQHDITLQRLTELVGLSRKTTALYLRLSRQNPVTRKRIEDSARLLFLEFDAPFPARPWEAIRERTPTRQETAPGSDLPEEIMTTPNPRLLPLEALQHFRLSADPFDDVDGMRLHMSARTKFNRAHLVRAIQQRRMAAIIAPPGGGKSTLLRLLHSQIVAQGVRVLWLTPGNLARGTISEGSLATAILRDLGLDVPNGAEQRGEALREGLERRCKAGEFPALVIDEGQDLTTQGLIACKRIYDSFTFNRSLAVIIAGQPPLLRRLRHDPKVAEVAGRMLVVEIPKMTSQEVRDYVNHRCELVGVNGDALFTDAGLSALQDVGGHNPLWINALCQAALEAGWQLGLERIDTDAVMASRR